MGSDGTPETALSTAARRMRRHRRRRRQGRYLVHVLLNTMEIETLIRKGYLDHQQRADPTAIQDAAESAIIDALAIDGGASLAAAQDSGHGSQ
jgi:hypothetical protein